jgi:hypothetical protein
MTVEEKLQQAESDLEKLITRATNALPTLKRMADDAENNWRKDITSELYINLADAISDARANQLRRRTG